MLQAPETMDFSKENITLIITGLPSVGKSTLALSAPNPVIIDADKGLVRVKPEHRKTAVVFKNYEEILEDIEKMKGVYETVIIDTGGALIDAIKDWAARNNEKARKRDGGISLQGFGIVRSEFLRLSAELRKDFNVVYLFHEKREKTDEGEWYDIICEGSAKEMVWLPASLGAHMFVQNGKRYLGFTPTENYNAKSSFGIKGIIEVPELGDGEPNNFLTLLFEKVRKNMADETEAFIKVKKAYNEAMAHGNELLEALDKPENAIATLEAIRGIEHSLTSLKELENAFKKRVKDNNWSYNPKTKKYEISKENAK